MTMLRSARRRGAACPMILGVLGFLLGLAALLIVLFHDPFTGGIRFRFSDPASSYDVNSATGSYTAQQKMQQNGDVRAMMAMMQRSSKKPSVKEYNESFKAEEKEFKREKDPKDKFDKGSGDCRILFIEYKRDGETVKEVAIMEKDNDTGIWERSRLSPAQVEAKDKDLAKKMREWPTKEKGFQPIDIPN